VNGGRNLNSGGGGGGQKDVDGGRRRFMNIIAGSRCFWREQQQCSFVFSTNPLRAT